MHTMVLQQATDYYRYCPGEERIKLSNAVCRGRRRTSFPKCKGCQFNDDERAQRVALTGADALPAGSVGASPAEGNVAHAPRASDEAGATASRQAAAANGKSARQDDKPAVLEQLFRETEVRGIAPLPLSTGIAWRIGYAAAQFLRSKLKGYDRADPRSRSLVTGCDLRSASAALHTAMVNGVRAAGISVCDIGAVDTPQVYFAVRRLGACGGIITTGGRDPAAYSGFKFCGAAARDMAKVTGLLDIRDITSRIPQHETGSFAPRFDVDMTDAYREFVRQFVRGEPALARPLTVVADASDGAAGRWAPALFNGLPGLTLVMLHAEAGEPFAHEPDPCHPRNLRELRRAVRAEEADFGVCFDGDADACAFVDDRGGGVRPDDAIALLARHILERSRGGTVVLDQRCGAAAAAEIERLSGRVQRERPVSSLIKKAMTESDAVFGGTLSGQFFFRDAGTCESGMLALAHMIDLVSESGRSLSDRVRGLMRDPADAAPPPADE